MNDQKMFEIQDIEFIEALVEALHTYYYNVN